MTPTPSQIRMVAINIRQLRTHGAKVRDALQHGMIRRRQVENASSSSQARHRLDRALSAVPVES